VAPPSRPVYRVGRSKEPLRPSRIAAEDALATRAGNRFDVVGGGVIYCGTNVKGCFAETVARFRPSPKMRDLMEHEDPGFVTCGGVPQNWRDQRTIVAASMADPLPFIDIDNPITHEYLNAKMAGELADLGVETLDVGNVRGANRLITRAASSWAYWAEDAGIPKYSGIRYMSRVLPDEECWAVFEGTPIVEVSRRAIEINDPDLKAVADMWGLRVF
jgi:RES domain